MTRAAIPASIDPLGNQGRLGAWLKRLFENRLRLRLATLTVVSVLLAVAFLGLLVHGLVAKSEDERLRQDAVSQLQEALDVMSQTGVTAFRSVIDDPSLPDDVREAALGGEVVSRRHKVGGEEVMTAASPIRPSQGTVSVLSVSIPAGESTAMLHQLDRALILASAASTLAVAVFAGFVTTRLTRRLGRAAAAARALPARLEAGEQGGGLAASLQPGRKREQRAEAGSAARHPDEVDRLAEAVDAMALRLRSRLETEQRFTADLAHELRTPLTGLLLAASLLDDSRPAQLVRDRTERLRVLVEDLLEVSRFEAGADQAQTEPANLGRAVASAVHRAAEEGVPWADQVEVEIEEPELVLLEQRRLDRIVSNLIKNAAAHGSQPLWVRVNGAELVVEDSGKGFPAEILSAGPSRFVTKGGGWGLGLTIARGQSRVQGADFSLGTGAGGGALARLRFPLAERGSDDDIPEVDEGRVQAPQAVRVSE